MKVEGNEIDINEFGNNNILQSLKNCVKISFQIITTSLILNLFFPMKQSLMLLPI